MINFFVTLKMRKRQLLVLWLPVAVYVSGHGDAMAGSLGEKQQEFRQLSETPVNSGKEPTLNKAVKEEQQISLDDLAKSLKNQLDSLDQRRVRLDQQQREIDVRRDILDQQKDRIFRQNSIINEHQSTISRQEQVLSKRGETISNQRYYLWLLSALVVLAVVLFAIIFKNSRNNKLVNIQLKKQHDLLSETSQQLRESRDLADSANLAKSTFLANMSHELRTPLNSVLGFSEFMARDYRMSHEQRKNIDVINRSGKHLLAMINDILDISKIESGVVELEEETVDLTNTLQEIHELMLIRAKDKSLKIVLGMSPDLPRTVKVDGIKLRQVLINLVGNAIKFTDQGEIKLTVSVSTNAQEKKRILFVVSDDGAGISDSDLEYIFQPFQQAGDNKARTGGTGLGLTISSQYVKLLGGEIAVASEPGKGADFRFDIPVGIVDKEKAVVLDFPRRVTGFEKSDPDWKILIVEDHVENRMLLKGILDMAGFIVDEAINGAEALERFTAFEPHLICMDIRMPVMNGLDATRKIRDMQGGKEVKIIAVTADAVKEQRNKALNAGCDDILFKPYRINEIFGLLGSALGVHYTYDAGNTENIKCTSESVQNELDKLPQDTLESLVTSARQLDHSLLKTSLQEIRESHASIYQSLTDLSENFRYDTIISLLTNTINNRQNIN